MSKLFPTKYQHPTTGMISVTVFYLISEVILMAFCGKATMFFPNLVSERSY